MLQSFIIERLNTSAAPRTIRDNLANLKNLGLIDSAGAGRGAKWFLAKKPKK